MLSCIGRTSDRPDILNMCYINTHSLRNETSKLDLTVDELSPDIIVVTETWLIIDVDSSPMIAG